MHSLTFSIRNVGQLMSDTFRIGTKPNINILLLSFLLKMPNFIFGGFINKH